MAAGESIGGGSAPNRAPVPRHAVNPQRAFSDRVYGRTGDELARIMRDLIMPSLTIRHVTTYRYRPCTA
jgi:hypothetical protein